MLIIQMKEEETFIGNNIHRQPGQGGILVS